MYINFLCNSSSLLTFSPRLIFLRLLLLSDHLNATRLDEKLNVKRVEFFYAEVFRAAFCAFFLRTLTVSPVSFGGVFSLTLADSPKEIKAHDDGNPLKMVMRDHVGFGAFLTQLTRCDF